MAERPKSQVELGASSADDRCAHDGAKCWHSCRGEPLRRCYRLLEGMMLSNPEPAEPDPVNHPAHYGGEGPYEAINVIEAWGLGFHLGNTVKYIARAGKKGSTDPEANAITDLKKARWYLDREIARREGRVEDG